MRLRQAHEAEHFRGCSVFTHRPIPTSLSASSERRPSTRPLSWSPSWISLAGFLVSGAYLRIGSLCTRMMSLRMRHVIHHHRIWLGNLFGER